MKKKYSIRAAFRRWSELTGDYHCGAYVKRAPQWFGIELKAAYKFVLVKTCKKHQRFTTGFQYEFILSDDDLLRITPASRDIFMEKRNIENTHING